MHSSPESYHQPGRTSRHIGRNPPSPIHTLSDWTDILRSHSHTEFAEVVRSHTTASCHPCPDVSGVSDIALSDVLDFSFGSWQSDAWVALCLEGIFKILNLDPAISLLNQAEINQLLTRGDTPTRWRRQRHFHDADTDVTPARIPTCCGPWHNGADHFVTMYICPDYWTILDPLVTGPYPRGRRLLTEANLHQALSTSFTARGLPTPPPSPRTDTSRG